MIVLFAMSHERDSDRQRLVRLFDTFTYVVAVCDYRNVTNPKECKELEPFYRAGRYIYISSDFKKLRNTTRSPNAIFGALSKIDAARRVLCLDYFFLQRTYYHERYGMDWLSSKCQDLLAYVDEVYLPIDKNGEMEEMVRHGHRGLTLARVNTSPLFESDKTIEIRGRPSAEQNVRLYLANPAFLKINRSH
jgi:hypothetical protein